MRSKLPILFGVLCFCLVPACVRKRVSEPGQEHVPSRFDRPAEDFIYEGMPRADLLDLMGEPRSVSRQTGREIWYYEFGLVVLENSQVTYRYPPRPGAESTSPPRGRTRNGR